MTDRWALADLRATAIMDASRTGAVAERNGRTLAQAAGLAAGLAAPTCGHARGPARDHVDDRACGHVDMPAAPPAIACLEFTVPTRPRGWQRDTPLAYGRSVKTEEEAAYQRDIGRFARQAKEAAGASGLLRGGVRLSVVAYLEVPKSYGKAKRADCLSGRVLPTCKPDADNAMKSVMDALTGVLWVDDKQVVAGSCLKVWAETPSLYIRVQAL